MTKRYILRSQVDSVDNILVNIPGLRDRGNGLQQFDVTLDQYSPEGGGRIRTLVASRDMLDGLIQALEDARNLYKAERG